MVLMLGFSSQSIRVLGQAASRCISFLGGTSSHYMSNVFTIANTLPHTGFGNTILGLGSVRPVTYASFQKGKRKSCKTVTERFYRLYWGAWIRPKAGRFKRFYRKNSSMRVGALQHVFCKGKQSHLLDKMVTKFWREKKYYVDDPYESYHTRDNFYITRKPV